MNETVFCKNQSRFTLRELRNSDANALADFFIGLSESTRSRFGPHPLTSKYADHLCQRQADDGVTRFVVESDKNIIGYFILNFGLVDHEVERYASYGIALQQSIDPLFAPCIADNYQNSGISSAVMNNLIEYVRQKKSRSLVLLGGTQESNELGIAFYHKWGFKECGRYFHRCNNIDMRLLL